MSCHIGRRNIALVMSKSDFLSSAILKCLIEIFQLNLRLQLYLQLFSVVAGETESQ